MSFTYTEWVRRTHRFSADASGDHRYGRSSQPNQRCVEWHAVTSVTPKGGASEYISDPATHAIRLAVTGSGDVEIVGALVADHAAREADQDRRQNRAARSVRHVPACRDRDSTAVVRRNPATDRRTATTAHADMRSNVIAAGSNRRAPGFRQLPNERLQMPDCTLAGSPRHRAPYLKSPIWIVGSRFRSMRKYAIVL